MNKMDDLISRQDAIDVAEESRRLNHHQDGKEACAHEYEHRHFLKLLRDLPSAQPEVIRCKDCKWYGRADKRRFYRGMDCLQKRIDTIIPDKDFCSRAERREE